MASKFRRGAVVYARDGRRYLVDDIEDGIVYCSSPGGAETEYPEAQLMTDTEWAARSDSRRANLYPRLKQAQAYTAAPKVDRTAAQQMLTKVERLAPGILDFAAHHTAGDILTQNGDQDLVAGLVISKCREVFEAAMPEIRAGVLAGVLGMTPDVLVGAGRLGDNLMRAMLDKGLTSHGTAFETFLGRRRT